MEYSRRSIEFLGPFVNALGRRLSSGTPRYASAAIHAILACLKITFSKYIDIMDKITIMKR
jgi:hypothetical protein